MAIVVEHCIQPQVWLHQCLLSCVPDLTLSQRTQFLSSLLLLFTPCCSSFLSFPLLSSVVLTSLSSLLPLISCTFLLIFFPLTTSLVYSYVLFYSIFSAVYAGYTSLLSYMYNIICYSTLFSSTSATLISSTRQTRDRKS